MNDNLLIESCLKKNIAAWAHLVKKYSPLVCASIENRMRRCALPINSRDIEDIKQDVFTDIWKHNKLESIKGRDDISYWIAIVAGNAAMERFRGRESRQAQKTVYLFDKIGEKELHELVPSAAAGPREKIADAEILEKVEGAMESLGTKEKLIIKLHLMHGKKYNEIARILNVPEGTVSNYIKRAKEKLRVALKNI